MQLSQSYGFLVAAIAVAFTPSASAEYDVGCLYPQEANADLFQARRNIVFRLTGDTKAYETPMVIRNSHIFTIGLAACVAFHTPGMLDPTTMEPPVFMVPPFAQNPYSMIMCMAQYSLHVAEDTLEQYANLKNNQGYAVTLPDDSPDLKAAVDRCPPNTSCSGECADLCRIMRAADHDPYVIGNYIGFKLKNYYDDDGWNNKGELQYSSTEDDVVPCTGNCRNFQSTVDYTPRPDPRNTQPFDQMTKYECTGDCRRWQPLQEGDDFGNLVEQESVVPHIGAHARTYLREPTLTLVDPMYDLYEDSLQVIEEVKMTSESITRKNAVELMDNKVKVRGWIQDKVLEQFADSRELPFQKYMMFLAGISTAEYDGVVQAWHEKVAHDLVRPTTVIKYWDDDELMTFGGDRNADGPVMIKARDFEAFIRVMPHGEFPSGSSCICKTYQEFTDTWLTDLYNRTVVDFMDDYGRDYEDMAEVLNVCGQSRIWGGMHYVASVPGGEQVCTGLGTLGVDWTKTVENGAVDSLDNLWYREDARPVCGENPPVA